MRADYDNVRLWFFSPPYRLHRTRPYERRRARGPGWCVQSADMTEPSRAFNRALRERLQRAGEFTTLVPAANVIDADVAAVRFPCVVIGEARVTVGDDFDVFFNQVCTDIHVWTEEYGLDTASAITGAIRDAIQEPWDVAGFRIMSVTLANTRVRRADSFHSHACLSVIARLQGEGS